MSIETPKNVLYSSRTVISTARRDLKCRTDLHLSRKIWHVLGVSGLVVTYNVLTRPLALKLFFTMTVLFVIFDVWRQHSPLIHRGLEAVFHPIMRDHERHRLAGTTYLLVGVFIILAVFPRSIVNLSLLFLAIADPLASLVGILYGRDKIWGQKTLQGTFAAFVACAVIGAIYFYLHEAMTERLVIVSILAGVIGALSELVPILDIDDNLTFPVVSSSLLFGLFWLFGGF